MGVPASAGQLRVDALVNWRWPAQRPDRASELLGATAWGSQPARWPTAPAAAHEAAPLASPRGAGPTRWWWQQLDGVCRLLDIWHATSKYPNSYKQGK
ncbi:MAG: hypothetical protein ACRDSZ_17475 [Pseudonocardiaceae bacterium]